MPASGLKLLDIWLVGYNILVGSNSKQIQDSASSSPLTFIGPDANGGEGASVKIAKIIAVCSW
jgi:hypothetical protein